MKKGSNTNTIKAQNNSLILNCIRKKPMSRAQISKLTELSKSAVTMLTQQLLEKGEILEIGTESTDFGRHPIMLDIDKRHRVAMGISLTRSEAAVCIVNLKLEIIDRAECAISSFEAAQQAIEWCCRSGFELLKKNNIESELCIGIGIAAPGPLDYKNGIILTPPNFPLFHNTNIKELFAKFTDKPVFLNNAPVLMAMYEYIKREENLQNYLFVSIDNGVGSAIIQKGNIYRGSAGFSGEIGHTTIDINGPVCICGNNGCLEGYVTKKAIEKRFGSPFNEMIDSAYNNDNFALEEIEKTARILSTGVINAVNILDIDAVIIFGELNYRSELLFTEIQKNIDKRSIITKAHKVKVLPSIITSKEDISYTTATVIEKYFNQEI